MIDFSLAVMASGTLGLTCIKHIHTLKKINFIFTDRKSEAIIQYATLHGIPFFAGNPRNNKAALFLQDRKTDVILSVNYLYIIEKDLIQFPSMYAINIHGSLLPKYRGRTPHVWSIINNEKETGITAHLISEACDEGDIIYQEKVTIEPDATGADLLNEFSGRYPAIIEKLFDLIETDRLTPVKQDSSKATYFGKRGPEEGEIDWNWQKERLYNWIRALASPYPGAFTFYKGNKIVVNKIEFIDYAFEFSQKNGEILEGGSHPLIKTSNGVVKLVAIQSEESIIFHKGDLIHAKY